MKAWSLNTYIIIIIGIKLKTNVRLARKSVSGSVNVCSIHNAVLCMLHVHGHMSVLIRVMSNLCVGVE